MLKEPFQWLAVSNDDTNIFEFDENNERKSIKEDVDINNICMFGIYGLEQYLFFYIENGIFNILGNMIKFTYEEDGKLYDFMTDKFDHSDVIIYRTVSQTPYSLEIMSYNFGFKGKIGNLHYKFIFHLNNNGDMTMTVKITKQNEILNGIFKVIVNDNEMKTFNDINVENSFSLNVSFNMEV